MGHGHPAKWKQDAIEAALRRGESKYNIAAKYRVSLGTVAYLKRNLSESPPLVLASPLRIGEMVAIVDLPRMIPDNDLLRFSVPLPEVILPVVQKPCVRPSKPVPVPKFAKPRPQAKSLPWDGIRPLSMQRMMGQKA